MNTAHRLSVSTAALLIGLGVSPALAQTTADNNLPVDSMQSAATQNSNAGSGELTASEVSRLERDEANARSMDGQRMNRDDRDVTKTSDSTNTEEFKDRDNERHDADINGRKEGWKHDQWNHDQWNHDQWDRDHWKHSGDDLQRVADTDDHRMEDRDFGQNRDDRDSSRRQDGHEEDRHFDGGDHNGDQGRDHFSNRQSGNMEMTGNEDHDFSNRRFDRDEDRDRDFDHKNDEHRTVSNQSDRDGDHDRNHMGGKNVTTPSTDMQPRNDNDGRSRRIFADSSAEVSSKDNDFSTEGRKDRDGGHGAKSSSTDDADGGGMKVRRIKVDDRALVDAGSSSSSSHKSGEMSHGVNGIHEPHHLKAFTMTHMNGGHKPLVPHVEHSMPVQHQVQPPHVTPIVTH